MNFFLFLFFFFFFSPRRTFPILRVAACHAGLYFYFRLEFLPSLAAKSPSTIFPNFIRLAAMLTLARHFLAPFSSIKSRFEAGENVYVCVCVTSVRSSAPSNFVKKKTRYHESDTWFVRNWNYNRKCNNNLKRKWKYSLDWWAEEIGIWKNSGCHFRNCKSRY